MTFPWPEFVVRCNFKQKDRVTRDEIVFTFSGELQELLGEASLDFKKGMEISWAYKITSGKENERSINTETQKIDKVGTTNEDTTQADLQTRPKRIRKDSYWFKDYEFDSQFSCTTW